MYNAPIRNSKLFEDQNNEMQKAFQAGYRKSLKEQYIPGPEVYDQWPPPHKGILPDSSDDGTPPFPKFPYGQQRSGRGRGRGRAKLSIRQMMANLIRRMK